MARESDDVSRRRSRRPSTYRYLKGFEALAGGAGLGAAARVAGVDRGHLRRLIASEPLLSLEIGLRRAERSGDEGALAHVHHEAHELATTRRTGRRPILVRLVIETIVKQAAKAETSRSRRTKPRVEEDVSDPLEALTVEQRRIFETLAIDD